MTALFRQHDNLPAERRARAFPLDAADTTLLVAVALIAGGLAFLGLAAGNPYLAAALPLLFVGLLLVVIVVGRERQRGRSA